MITKPIKPSKQITKALPDILDTPWNPRIYTFIHEYKQTEFCSSRDGGGGGGGGREGTLNKVLYGEALPRGPTPYHFISTIFDRKGALFRDKWYPFHIPILEQYIPSTHEIPDSFLYLKPEKDIPFGRGLPV